MVSVKRPKCRAFKSSAINQLESTVSGCRPSLLEPTIFTLKLNNVICFSKFIVNFSFRGCHRQCPCSTVSLVLLQVLWFVWEVRRLRRRSVETEASEAAAGGAGHCTLPARGGLSASWREQVYHQEVKIRTAQGRLRNVYVFLECIIYSKKNLNNAKRNAKIQLFIWNMCP